MALKIRLQRHGSTHNPIYRMVVTESRHRRDGRHNEVLGNYAPKARGKDPELQLRLDRIEYWLSVGAQPSDTARTLINRARRDPSCIKPDPVAVAAAAAAATAETEGDAAPAEASSESPAETTTAAE